MNAVVPIPFTTPDGVVRYLRASFGARKRIHDKYKADVTVVLKERGDTCLPEVAYALMFDEQGKPPADLSLECLEEQLPADAAPELMAAVLSAFTQGKHSKNEVEALLKEVLAVEAQKLIGSPSGVSSLSASDSQTNSSGGDTPKSSVLPDSNGTKKNRKSSTIALVS